MYIHKNICIYYRVGRKWMRGKHTIFHPCLVPLIYISWAGAMLLDVTCMSRSCAEQWDGTCNLFEKFGHSDSSAIQFGCSHMLGIAHTKHSFSQFKRIEHACIYIYIYIYCIYSSNYIR